MSTLTTHQINNLKIEEIDQLLNSGKYIPNMKKNLLSERKKKLNSKYFNNNLEDFPKLLNINLKEENLKNNAWAKKSEKIYDTKNVPQVKQKNILKKTNTHDDNKEKKYNNNNEEDDDLYVYDDY